MRTNRIVLGGLLCLLASMSWGAMFPVAHSAMKHVDAFYFSLIRYSVVTIVLIGLLWWKEGKKAFRMGKEGKVLWFYGTMAFTVYNFFIFLGQDWLGESGILIASIMEALMPMMSVIFMWIYKRARPSRFTVFTIGAAFVGVLLIVTKGDLGAFMLSGHALLAVGLLLLAVLGWLIYTMGGNRYSDWSILRYSALSCLLGTGTSAVIVAILTAFGILHVPTVETLVQISPEMSFMIIFPGVIALLSWNLGVKWLTPINAILFINFVPVTTLVVSVAQGYQLTLFDLSGTGLVMAALIGNNLYQRRKAKALKPVVLTSPRVPGNASRA
ncbi:DMT family transporter [Paenibacillus sp. J2TS4]|uniref:DMT family transporter n=1 Tax=Paenibacillus sp. J2TS4 TaxID=2807194 RepID=UPI001B2625D5|nr:DMT family transporter [Paenibacillus sp. J2TS4]GIP34805.1 transporter [Paenibacillus sp. J2TS4]